MLMKKITLLLILFLSLEFNLFSQHFDSNIGTNWYYEKGYAFSGNKDYFNITSTKDTIINTITCKKLVSNSIPACGARRTINEYIYENDSIIYFYDFDRTEFQILYNFKTPVNGSWKSIITNPSADNDTIITTVTSKGFTTINSISLKTLFVTYSSNYSVHTYTSQIIYGIGDIDYLFNLRPKYYAVCDIDYADGIRCHDDNYFGNYSSGLRASCKYIGRLIKQSTTLKAGLYPLLANHWIQLKGIETSEIVSLDLIDNSGHFIKSFPTKEIKIAGTKPGIYFLKIKLTNERELFEKIIIE